MSLSRLYLFFVHQQNFDFDLNRDHCQRLSPSQISGMPQAGFERARVGLSAWF